MKKKPQKKWSAREFAILKEWYPIEGSPGVLARLRAEGFERAKGTVSATAWRLGLKSGLIGQPNAGQWKKGGHSFNKGKKMTPEQKAKSAHTFFKKGQRPHNTLYDLAVVKSRNRHEKGEFAWQIRICLKKWIMLNTFAWQELHGDIPPHHIVAMSPGFDELCHRFFPTKPPKTEPERHWENLCAFVQAARPYLKLITKAENAQRNSGDHLSFNYVAGFLTKGNPGLRQFIKDQAPQLVEVERQRRANNRLIKQIANEQ